MSTKIATVSRAYVPLLAQVEILLSGIVSGLLNYLVLVKGLRLIFCLFRANSNINSSLSSSKKGNQGVRVQRPRRGWYGNRTESVTKMDEQPEK